MENQNEQIDKLFKNGLSNYEEPTSSAAWDLIENQLPAKNRHSVYWIAASIAAVLMASVVVWNIMLKKTNSFNYETADISIKANYPQKEFIPVPIIIHTISVVYIQKQTLSTNLAYKNNPKLGIPTHTYISSDLDVKKLSSTYALNTNSIPSLEKPNLSTNQPITIIYKKGDDKHPKLTKAFSFFKQVSEGERPLIDFEKISSELIARRETNNNSNN